MAWCSQCTLPCPPKPLADKYVPKVFGFKIHPSAWEQQPQGAKRPPSQQGQQQQGSRQALGNGTAGAAEQQQQQPADEQQQQQQQADGATAKA